MDDLIAMASIVQKPHKRWVDMLTHIISPENVARQQRLKQFDVEIENILKLSRADTQGHAYAGPIKALVREQMRLQEEVERDTKLYEQELLEARAEMNAASLIGAQSIPSIRSNLESPTPSRSSVNESQRRSRHCEDPGKESGGNAGENNNEDGEENYRAKDDHHGPQYTFDENQRKEFPQAKRNNALLDGPRPLPSNTPAIMSPEPEYHGDEHFGEPLQTPAITSMHSGKKRKRASTKLSAYRWKFPTSFADLNPRIINLKPGDIVSVWCKKQNHFVPAMTLPWGRFELFGYDHTLDAVKLNKKIPKCYDGSQSDDMTPRPWAPGYENEGDLAHRRMIPGLYFRNQEDFPVDCQSDWLPLNKLKIFDKMCSHTINKEAVLECLEFCAK